MKRFFNEASFWNQPIESNAEVDPESTAIIDSMAAFDARGLWINAHKWTIPIYEVNRDSPRRRVGKVLEAGIGKMKLSGSFIGPDHPMGHGAAFAEDANSGNIPIPDYAIPDPEGDRHIALVDWESGWIWDMWGARRREDGEWEAKTGMKYRADGPGVFQRENFAVHNGESIHPYGPSRAAGVPALAGTIMHHEILEGRIEHKLAFASRAAALMRFIYPPACWCDGCCETGIPEGAVLQLDPDLDLQSFRLSPGAAVVARALQEYGAVCVDASGGHPLYAEGLYGDPRGRTWQGLLEEDGLSGLELHNYRVLKMENVVAQGMSIAGWGPL